ncbi:MAG: hypothetical protein LKJ29_08690 [Lactobacillus sp.]|jgi:hypothetical protein|nr:hypothetical protein [Lacticaseibacillus suilingensis]MCI1895063.1 hypothetical protein [Lactobacillus sp.]MCI1918377.1 hypothetical protein [Lactobacillus sp.]MCI1942114.1 hypothetical protein [Lactobacillus sp.]MCI1972497.1 hypothetical protein [Lactobacillus sp.]MCI2017211.1 hypothetical protein [Lactobacillus sp.]
MQSLNEKLMNLQMTPFSSRGSYIALIEKGPDTVTASDVGEVPQDGLYLKSLHGISSHAPAVARVFPTLDGEEVDYDYLVDPEMVTLNTTEGHVYFRFDVSGNLMMSTKGAGLGIGLDFIPDPKSKFDHAIQTLADGIVVNSYKTLTKYSLKLLQGQFKLQKSSAYKNASLHPDVILISPGSDDKCQLSLAEVKHYMSWDYDKLQHAAEEAEPSSMHFHDFAERYHAAVPDDPNPEVTDLALYTIWTCIVSPQGNLTRETIWMSNTHFPGIWTWDQAYVALGLAGIYPKLAYDELMGPYDFQDEYGQLPGSFSDSTVRWNFSKPPVQGLVLDSFIKLQELNRKQLTECYIKIPKQIDYWLNYADLNHDGLPEYQHGNDSGYDNSTVFDKSEYVTSPDLTAYLIRSYDVLGEIAAKLGRKADIVKWDTLAAELTKRFVDKLVVNDLPVARDGLTSEVVDSKSQLPLAALSMGSRLPEAIRKNIIALYHSTDYLTDYGIATESTSSAKYESHSYWRGPVWPSEMANIYIALKLVHEDEFAADLAKRFCRAVIQSGIRENFDAQTGTGYDDTAHTWTAGAYLFFTRELFGSK